MFSPQPIKVKKPDVVSEMPQRLRKNMASDWGNANFNGKRLDAFLEGPCFDSEGNLYLVDIPFGRILSYDRNGNWDVLAEYQGWPNGMKVVDGQRLVISDYRLGLVEISLSDKSIRILVDSYRSEGLLGPNDLTLAANGDIYFTDQGQSGWQNPNGRVFHYSKSGRLNLLLGGMPSPNGLVLNENENVLFVAMTRGNSIWRLPLLNDGGVSKVGTYIQLSGGIGPDGITCDGKGGLIVAHPGVGVWRFDESGLPTHLWKGGPHCYFTNIAAHPLFKNTFFITDSKKAIILKIYLDID